MFEVFISHSGLFFPSLQTNMGMTNSNHHQEKRVLASQMLSFIKIRVPSKTTQNMFKQEPLAMFSCAAFDMEIRAERMSRQTFSSNVLFITF